MHRYDTKSTSRTTTQKARAAVTCHRNAASGILRYGAVALTSDFTHPRSLNKLGRRLFFSLCSQIPAALIKSFCNDIFAIRGSLLQCTGAGRTAHQRRHYSHTWS